MLIASITQDPQATKIHIDDIDENASEFRGLILKLESGYKTKNNSIRSNHIIYRLNKIFFLIFITAENKKF